jgi:hypothetical protein
MPQAKRHTITMPVKRVSVEKLIRDHQAATRTERRLKTKLDQLYKKHPGLEQLRPLLHVHTYDGGQKAFARWTDDFDRQFPKSFPYAPDRKKFIETAEAALPEHFKKRKAAGIVDAERLRLDASGTRIRAFWRICGVTPRTAREAGLIASYMLKALPIEAEGKIFGRIPGGTGRAYAEWKTRQELRDRVFDSMGRLLHSFAKAA